MGVARGKAECYERTSSLISEVYKIFFSILDVTYFGGTVCRTKALKEAGGFDIRIRRASEDVDIETRMSLKGWRSVMNNAAKFFHMGKDSFKSIVTRYIWYGEGNNFLYHKYEGFISILRRLPLVTFLWGLKLAGKAYISYQKRVFSHTFFMRPYQYLLVYRFYKRSLKWVWAFPPRI